MKTIGSLFTLAGETLSAIGRMIERPAFNDDANTPVLAGFRRTCIDLSRISQIKG